jgi:RHS repeat-associated protein
MISFVKQVPPIMDFIKSHLPIKITDPEGNISYIFYDYQHKDCYGQSVLKKITVDPLGNQVITVMNTQNQPACILGLNSLGELLAKKELFYDGMQCNSSCETVITPNAPIRTIWTNWTYDEAGNLASLTEALGTPEEKITRYEYNNAGQKQAIIKPDGTKIHHEYDPLGRLSAVFASDNSFSYLYSYDKNHNLIEVRDGITNQVTQRCYDKNGNITSEQIGNGLTMQFSYDRLGKLTLQILPDQSSIATSYDSLHMKTVSRLSPEGKILYTHTYNCYDQSGNILSSGKPHGLGETIFSYDSNDRIKNWESVDTAWFQTLTYDTIGNLIQSNYNDPLGSITSNFIYNDLYQLRSESGIANHTYETDSLYNCINKDGNPYNVNSLNQLLHQSDIDYTYDKNGNLIASGEKRYSYDAYDRLLSVTEGEQRVTYSYDAFNRRLSKTASCSNNSITTLYLYQDQNEIGACNEEKNLIELRLLGLGKGAEIGAAIALELDGKLSIPIHDNNGNVVGLLDSSGNILESYRYSAYGVGQIFNAPGEKIADSINPWRYASKRCDPETGFLYFGRRYYDPATSRWITADPAGFEARPNLYAYVLNNPLTHFDLYGLIDEEDGSIHRPYHSFFDEWATSSSRSGMAWDFCKHSVGGFFEGCIAKWARDPIGSYNQFGRRGYIDRNSTDWRQSTRYASESLGESTTMGAALFGTDVAISAAMPLILGARFLQSGISFLSQGIKSLRSGLRPKPSTW